MSGFMEDNKTNQPIIDSIAAIKFIESSENTYVACIWPTAQGKDKQIENLIPNIVYRKNVTLNYRGAHNLMSQIYTSGSWVGDVSNNFKGAQLKAAICFKKKDPIRVVVFQADSLQTVLKIKKNIRSAFNLGFFSIHTTDTKEDTIDISRLLFNDNSIHFLNHAKPNAFLDFHENLVEVKKFLECNNIKKNNFVLSGDMVLAAYGLKKTSVIDYFSSKDTVINNQMVNFNSHDSELEFHKKQKEELIYNPKNYFYFQGLKYTSLNQLFIMKKNRSNEKDKHDFKLKRGLIDINLFQKKLNHIELRFLQEKALIGTNLRNSLIGTSLRNSLNGTILFHPIRSIYRFMYNTK